jgi:hypothetical protein
VFLGVRLPSNSMFVALPPMSLLVYGCVVVKCEKTNQYHCTKTSNLNHHQNELVQSQTTTYIVKLMSHKYSKHSIQKVHEVKWLCVEPKTYSSVEPLSKDFS